MSGTDDYCELCDLPRSQCVHGRPPEPVTRAPEKKAPEKKAPTAPRERKPRTSATAAAPTATRRVSRRWTPPDALKPEVLAVLDDAGGELESDALFAALEARIGEQLLPGDRELTPEGELRWQYAARRARQALISEGLMTRVGPGVWKLA